MDAQSLVALLWRNLEKVDGHERFTLAEVKVLLLLQHDEPDDDGFVELKRESVANRLGFKSINPVRIALQSLEAKSVIEAVGSQGRPYRYRILTPRLPAPEIRRKRKINTSGKRGGGRI